MPQLSMTCSCHKFQDTGSLLSLSLCRCSSELACVCMCVCLCVSVCVCVCVCVCLLFSVFLSFIVSLSLSLSLSLRFDWSGRKRDLLCDESSRVKFEALRSGQCDAVLMWWDVTMDTEGEVMLSCAPFWAHPDLEGK